MPSSQRLLVMAALVGWRTKVTSRSMRKIVLGITRGLIIRHDVSLSFDHSTYH